MKVLLQFGKCSLVRIPTFLTRTKHAAMAVFHSYAVNASRKRPTSIEAVIEFKYPLFHLEQNIQQWRVSHLLP